MSRVRLCVNLQVLLIDVVPGICAGNAMSNAEPAGRAGIITLGLANTTEIAGGDGTFARSIHPPVSAGGLLLVVFGGWLILGFVVSLRVLRDEAAIVAQFIFHKVDIVVNRVNT